MVICAYNEANNIGRVLKSLAKVDWMDDILVVDDCSKDDTAEVARRHGARVISHQVNQGKGGALATGIENAKYDTIICLDADLIGLSELHLKQMLSPVIFTKEAKMTLGVFGRGEITATNIANRIIPGISGQRAIQREDLPPLDTFRDKRYGVDILLTRHLPEEQIIVVELDGLSQVTKEDKEKFFQAMKSRVKMYKDIYTTLKQDKDGRKE